MPSISEKFRLLRLRVQHDIQVPAVLAVSAAQRYDGTTYVACGLARAFAEAGYNTLLLDANPHHPGVGDYFGTHVRADAAKPQRVDNNLSIAALFRAEERIVGETELDEIVSGARWGFAVTVLDLPLLPNSGAAQQLANAADGLLIALRLGRRPTEDDGELKALVSAGGLLNGKRFTGVVTTRATRHRGANGVDLPEVLPAPQESGTRLVPRVQRSST